jgi:hypothetical protein
VHGLGEGRARTWPSAPTGALPSARTQLEEGPSSLNKSEGRQILVLEALSIVAFAAGSAVGGLLTSLSAGCGGDCGFEGEPVLPPIPAVYDVIDARNEHAVGGTAEITGVYGEEPVFLTIRYEVDGVPHEAIYTYSR